MKQGVEFRQTTNVRREFTYMAKIMNHSKRSDRDALRMDHGFPYGECMVGG